MVRFVDDDQQRLSTPIERRHDTTTVSPLLNEDRTFHGRISPELDVMNDAECVVLTTTEPKALAKTIDTSPIHLPADQVNDGHHSTRHPTLVQRSRYFLRSIGLGIISFKLTSRKHRHEGKKVVINISVWVALSRCGVHIAPLLATITLLWFNIHGFFIGASLAGPQSCSDDVKLALLQFAAKAHELLIIASTATAVFHVIRDQLLFGERVPLGLLSSGISFSQPGYFWYAYPVHQRKSLTLNCNQVS